MTPSSTPNAPDLVSLLTLTSRGSDDHGQDTYLGESSPQPHGRVFGGQVLAQALRAATDTVPGDRPVHSMHGYFLRPGDLSVPITFSVERLRDGQSFSARRVHAIQHDRPILSMIASFQTADDGVDHSATMPDVPAPETLPSTADLMVGVDHPVARYWAEQRPIDIRHIDEPIYFAPSGDPQPRQALWMRSHAPLPDDDALHRAVLAYASDYTLLEPVLRRHSLAWSTPGIKGASLDHAMWWHRSARIDQWVLCLLESPSASGGRGLTHATFFSPDGAHIATATQELMIRTAR